MKKMLRYVLVSREHVAGSAKPVEVREAITVLTPFMAMWLSTISRGDKTIWRAAT